MDQRSQYLAQALAQTPTFATPDYSGPSPQGMLALAQKAKAFHAANPDGSFVGHQLMQAGRNLAAAPGNAMNGLARLAQSLPGMAKPQPFDAVSAVPQLQAQIQPNGPLITPPSY